MHIVFIINDRHCPSGLVHEVVRAAGHGITTFHPHEGDELPGTIPASWDGLIVFGGRMSAFDDDQYPALEAVARLIRTAHQQGLPVLGICLGAQQLARALGKTRIRLPAFEVGFVPLHLTEAGYSDPLLNNVKVPPVMQVHEDNFAVPDDGALLLYSDMSPVQAVRVGATSYGFQCHFEVIGDDLKKWLSMLESEYSSSWNDMQIEKLREAQSNFDGLLGPAMTFGREVTSRWLKMAESL